MIQEGLDSHLLFTRVFQKKKFSFIGTKTDTVVIPVINTDIFTDSYAFPSLNEKLEDTKIVLFRVVMLSF